jgi:hypothetical protein
VRWLQAILNQRGWGELAESGEFDGATELAVKAMQRDLEVGDDGRYGKNTAKALAAFLQREGPSPRPRDDGAGSGKPADPVADWSKVHADQRRRYVILRLVERYRYDVNGAAGIVGNLYAESAVIPNRIEGSTIGAPMTAKDASGNKVTFTPEQVMNRRKGVTGPARPGIGLAQWTTKGRRAGLFAHPYQGRPLGANVLFDMDAQIDYLDHELRNAFAGLHQRLVTAGITVDQASDDVVYEFEIPGAILGADGKRLPRAHDAVRTVFAARRAESAKALQAFRA